MWFFELSSPIMRILNTGFVNTKTSASELAQTMLKVRFLLAIMSSSPNISFVLKSFTYGYVFIQKSLLNFPRKDIIMLFSFFVVLWCSYSHRILATESTSHSRYSRSWICYSQHPLASWAKGPRNTCKPKPKQTQNYQMNLLKNHAKKVNGNF